MTIADQIKKALEEQGQSASWLSRQIGQTSPAWMLRVLAGQDASDERLQAIADVLGVVLVRPARVIPERRVPATTFTPAK